MTPNTPTSDDLMERLRKSAEADAFFDDANGAEMHLAAADHIAALRARCEALEGHLRFAVKLLKPWAGGTAQIEEMEAALSHRTPSPEAK